MAVPRANQRLTRRSEDAEVAAFVARVQNEVAPTVCVPGRRARGTESLNVEAQQNVSKCTTTRQPRDKHKNEHLCDNLRTPIYVVLCRVEMGAPERPEQHEHNVTKVAGARDEEVGREATSASEARIGEREVRPPKACVPEENVHPHLCKPVRTPAEVPSRAIQQDHRHREDRLLRWRQWPAEAGGVVRNQHNEQRGRAA